MNNALGLETSSNGTADATTETDGTRDASTHPSRAQVGRHPRHPWRIPASPQYLRAIREADLAVRRAAYRWRVLRHSSRLLEP